MDKKHEVASKMIYGKIEGHKGPKKYGALKPNEEKEMLAFKQRQGQEALARMKSKTQPTKGIAGRWIYK